MSLDPAQLQDAAKRHLWMHFTRMGDYATHEVPIIVRGDGPWVWDSKGKRYLDGLSGLFVVQVGHGRQELADAGARQAAQLGYFPVWGYAHPSAVELAERLTELTPGDLNRVFFTGGGSEAVESAWKLARQYFKVIGQPERTKAISREISYHGTTMGALSITGYEAIKKPFEPLVPGTSRVPNTDFFRAPVHGDDLEAFGLWAADKIAERIEEEGPETVAAVFLEPVQNAGGCFVPPPGYFARVREICDRYGVLLVSDEIICAFGRLGYWFGSERYGYQPDMITVAKGLTSGYAPMGALLASDRLIEPFLHGDHVVRARDHVRRSPGICRRRPGQPRHLRGGEAPCPCAFERGGFSLDPAHPRRPADSGRRPRRRLLLRRGTGEGQGDQRDLQHRGNRTPAAGFPIAGAVRGRPGLSRRRPRRPRRPVRPAPYMRAGAFRHHRATCSGTCSPGRHPLSELPGNLARPS